jgi:5'-nucleotidase
MKKKILITNDDGILSKGLVTLAKAVEPYAEISVVAPLHEKSGSGLSTSFSKPLRILPNQSISPIEAWTVNGTPADCVKLGLNHLHPSLPDMILSGINRGSNAGKNVLYSGTIGAIIEGIYRNNIPGIAFSCIEFTWPDYTKIIPFILPIIQHTEKYPLPPGSLLNVNFPLTSQPTRGIRYAKQGKAFWTDTPEEREHPSGGSYYWLKGKWLDAQEPGDSDVHLLQQGFITAVPIHVHELTDHRHYEEHKEIFEKSLQHLLPE